jgi:dihydroxy-acid dehydratase
VQDREKLGAQCFCYSQKVLFFQEGGPIGLVQNGDTITIDVAKRVIDVDLTEEQLEERRRKWSPPSYKATRGALWKVLWL